MTTEDVTTASQAAEAATASATEAAASAAADQGTQEGAAPASSQADDAAAFEAGFNGVNNTAPPEPEPKPESTFAGYTEAEIKAAMERIQKLDTLEQSQSKAFGMLGALKQSIEGIRSQPGTPAKLTRESLKRLNVEYPDLADALAEDLGSFGGGQAAAIDPTQINDIVSNGIRTARNADASEFLKDEHGDWVATVKSPEFNAYLNTLDEQTRERVKRSENPFYVSKQLVQFNDWKAKSVQAAKAKNTRLEAAIAPTKGGAPGKAGPTDEDAFMAGFKAVRGGA